MVSLNCCRIIIFNIIRLSAMFDHSYKIQKSFIHTIDLGFYNYIGNLSQGEEEIAQGKQWNTEGNVNWDKKGGFRKRSVGHKRETIFTVITMKSLRKIIVHECSKAHNDAGVQPTYLLCWKKSLPQDILCTIFI